MYDVARYRQVRWDLAQNIGYAVTQTSGEDAGAEPRRTVRSDWLGAIRAG